LEALLEEPANGGDSSGAPRLCAVVCHPHPLYGGTMHNKVVYRIARGLRRAGIVVLRFNFRGVGASEGEHANFIGEVEDARAALDWLRHRYPRSGYALAGFSFGARVITQLGCAAEEVSFLIAVGFPTGNDGLDYLAHCPARKVFIQSTNDQYGPRASLEAVYADFAEPKQLLWVEAQDHFFTGGLEELEETVCGAATAALR
jgi:alpha/beta superfamily hydrolase